MSDVIASLGERALVARLRARLEADPPAVRIGIGDDAAVLVPERQTQIVLTTDSLVEGVHFRRDWTTANAIGYKALAVNLSDIAAMGATPQASLLSLAVPANLPLADFDALIDGYARLAHDTRTPLVGGNLARSPGPLVVDVTVIGHVRPRRVLTRAGARPGDELYVTGLPGMAAAGLAVLSRMAGRETLTDEERACVDRHERPEPRLRLGRVVGRVGAAAAAMDLSDGLADAARTLAEAAGIGVVVDGATLPVHAGVRAVAEAEARRPIDLVVGGGEDYELAFAVSPRRRSRFLAAVGRAGQVPVTRVGVFEAAPGAWLDVEGVRTPLPTGFHHF